MGNQNKLIIGLIIGIPVLVGTVMGALSGNGNTIPIECESICQQTIDDLTRRLSELQGRFDLLHTQYTSLQNDNDQLTNLLSLAQKNQLGFKTQGGDRNTNTHTNSIKNSKPGIDNLMTKLINGITYHHTITTVVDGSRLETLKIINTHTRSLVPGSDRIVTIYQTGPTIYLGGNNGGGGGGNNSSGGGGGGDPLKPFSPYFRCSSPWGGVPLDHGDTIFAYAQNTVEYPTTCKGENRVCDNGTLKGSYTSKTCTQIGDQCSTDRGILTHGQTINAYSANSVPYGSDCSSKIEIRKCIDGTLGGTAPFKTCTISEPKGCLGPDGRMWGHTVIAVYYQYAKVLGEPKDGVDLCPRETRKCLNGVRYVPDGSITKNFIFNKPHCIAEVP